MKILMTGATGMIGSGLGQKLVELGHNLVVITRNKKHAKENLTFFAEVIEFDLSQNTLPVEFFKDIDAVVNLAGESIDGRWTADKKEKILSSRSVNSRNLMQNCPTTVSVAVSASGIGIYGDRADEKLTESSSLGSGFLTEVCRQWEAPFLELRSPRCVIVRTGIVLSKKGGALKKLIDLFQKNLGAVLGSGQQWMSYISLEDIVNVYIEALQNKSCSRVLNACNQQPVQNEVFTSLLCQKLDVLQLPRVPSIVLKGLLGEMQHLVLDSACVIPEKLIELGFQFKHSSLETILEEELMSTEQKYSIFYTEQFIPYGVEPIFDFFSNHANLEKITPDILNFKTEKISTARVEKDTLIDYRLKIRGVPIGWRTLIETWDRPRKFVDTQLKGPYSYWRHTHKFIPVKNGTLMTDEVQYKVPLGELGRLVAGSFVESDVQKIFAYRRKVIAVTNFDESFSGT
jgi:uncharacterized protein